MTVQVNKDLVSPPPRAGVIADKDGRLNRDWAIWFRDIYARISLRGNPIDASIETIDDLILVVELNAENIAINATNISQNTNDISSNAAAIALNVAAIAANLVRIQQNETDIATNAASILANVVAIAAVSGTLTAHTSANTAHGSNGDIVGKSDTATESFAGLVQRMANITDATATAASVVVADVVAAPATYNQAYTQTIADLANANKSAINTIATDLNAAIGKLNDLLANSRTSGQMTTP